MSRHASLVGFLIVLSVVALHRLEWSQLPVIVFRVAYQSTGFTKPRRGLVLSCRRTEILQRQSKGDQGGSYRPRPEQLSLVMPKKITLNVLMPKLAMHHAA